MRETERSEAAYNEKEAKRENKFAGIKIKMCKANREFGRIKAKIRLQNE